MTNITARDGGIEAKAGVYYFGRRLFFMLFVLTFIALMGLFFVYDSLSNADLMFTSLLWTTLFWFLVYKLADCRVQHIETITYHKQQQSSEDVEV